MSRRISEALRQLVEGRARGKCEYCRLPKEARLFRFPIDHIVAVKHGGATSPDNLALACLTCNVHKGSDIAALDPDTGVLASLYHPRRHAWDNHFRLDQSTGEIHGKTPEGRRTVVLLQMNTWERTEERLRLMGAGRLL